MRPLLSRKATRSSPRSLTRAGGQSFSGNSAESSAGCQYRRMSSPAGELMRRYWQPALLSAELPENDCPPARVRLLGEDLVAFRDSNGRIGLIDAYCPHRRASMFFGRNEECGLRCVYHGWKFDVDGNCMDMPNEAAHGEFSTMVDAAQPPIGRAHGLNPVT